LRHTTWCAPAGARARGKKKRGAGNAHVGEGHGRNERQQRCGEEGGARRHRGVCREKRRAFRVRRRAALGLDVAAFGFLPFWSSTVLVIVILHKQDQRARVICYIVKGSGWQASDIGAGGHLTQVVQAQFSFHEHMGAHGYRPLNPSVLYLLPARSVKR